MKTTLFDILQTGESQTAEFKTSFSDEVIVSLVAFCNAEGGTVYVGISDNKEIKGVQLGKETVVQWLNEIKNKTMPTVVPNVDLIETNQSTVVALSVVEYPVKPVSVKGRYYKRTGNANHLMTLNEIANDHLQTINTSWDYYVDFNHTLADISDKKIRKYMLEVEKYSGKEISMTEKDFLSKFEILRNGQLTFGAYLLFANDYCSISDVQIGRFKSPTTIIDSLSLNTDLFTEVDEILSFIKKHLMVEYIITGKAQRTERFNYPLEAIREIVLNMIVHRDYRDSSASVIKIFDDKIEFYNPGTLYGGITVERLLSGDYVSKSRNKLIAKAFKEIGFIERYGSGIARIRKICKDYGISEPKYQMIDEGFMVTIYSKASNNTNGTLNGTLNGILNGTLNETQQRVFSFIGEHHGTNATTMIDQLGIPRNTLNKIIRYLTEHQLIERRGSKKTGGYWQINKEKK